MLLAPTLKEIGLTLTSVVQSKHIKLCLLHDELEDIPSNATRAVPSLLIDLPRKCLFVLTLRHLYKYYLGTSSDHCCDFPTFCIERSVHRFPSHERHGNENEGCISLRYGLFDTWLTSWWNPNSVVEPMEVSITGVQESWNTWIWISTSYMFAPESHMQI